LRYTTPSLFQSDGSFKNFHFSVADCLKNKANFQMQSYITIQTTKKDFEFSF